MDVPVIFNDVNTYRYTIDEHCHIKRDNIMIDNSDLVYRSTNGSIYVLLESMTGSLKLYKLDMLVYNSFHPNTQINHEHFNVIHLDGNPENSNLTNLEYADDIEQWRDVIYPDWIPKGKYMISSWGRMMNASTGKILSCPEDSHGYPRCTIYVNKRMKNRFVHQLVMAHFSVNPDEHRYNQINHIDGDPHNNHITNLEWADNKINADHAYLLRLNTGNYKASDDEIDMIVDLLIKHKGSIITVLKSIDKKTHPSITYSIISSIKYSKRFVDNPKSRYYMTDVQFTRCQESRLSTSDIDMVIEMLLDNRYDGSVTKVYNAIDHARFPYISKGIVNLIKCRNPIYFRNDSRYDLANVHFKSHHSRWK